jgi:hypothetical protein
MLVNGHIQHSGDHADDGTIEGEHRYLALLVEPLPHFLDPRSRRPGAEELPRPSTGFRVGTLLREPFLHGNPLFPRLRGPAY